MIPKIIHYCWFGKGPKSPLILKCIESWKIHLPDYEIKEWNEDNFDVNSHPYTKNAYNSKKWAFITDYVRLKVLQEAGGIYLDTDMYILKSFNDFLDYDLVLGKEDGLHISAGMIGAGIENDYIKDLLEKYNSLKERETIPRIMTEIFNKNIEKYETQNMKIKIFDPIYFYPFTADNINKFNYKNAPSESYAVHLWNYSWGNPVNKFIKKIGLHKQLKKLTERLGIKRILKKVLGMK